MSDYLKSIDCLKAIRSAAENMHELDELEKAKRVLEEREKAVLRIKASEFLKSVVKEFNDQESEKDHLIWTPNGGFQVGRYRDCPKDVKVQLTKSPFIYFNDIGPLAFFSNLAVLAYQAAKEKNLHHVKALLSFLSLGTFDKKSLRLNFKEKGGNLLGKALYMIFFNINFDFEEFFSELLTRHAGNNPEWCSGNDLLEESSGNRPLISLVLWIHDWIHWMNRRAGKYRSNLSYIGAISDLANTFSLELPMTIVELATRLSLPPTFFKDLFEDIDDQLEENKLVKERGDLTDEELEKKFKKLRLKKEEKDLKKAEERRLAEEKRLVEEKRLAEEKRIFNQKRDVFVQNFCSNHAQTDIYKQEIFQVLENLGYIPDLDNQEHRVVFWNLLRKILRDVKNLGSKIRGSSIQEESKDDEGLDEVVKCQRWESKVHQATCYACEAHGPTRCKKNMLFMPHGPDTTQKTRDMAFEWLDWHLRRFLHLFCFGCFCFFASKELLDLHMKSGVPCDPCRTRYCASVENHTCSFCGNKGHLEGLCRKKVDEVNQEKFRTNNPFPRKTRYVKRSKKKRLLEKGWEESKNPTIDAKRRKQSKEWVESKGLEFNDKDMVVLQKPNSQPPAPPLPHDLYTRFRDTGIVKKVWKVKKGHYVFDDVFDDHSVARKDNEGKTWDFCVPLPRVSS